MNKTLIIKSTKCSLSFVNKGKRDSIDLFINEYQNVVSLFVDILWDLDKIPTLLDNEFTSKINTWLSARLVQCAGKQASAIVRGTREKQRRRQFYIDKFNEEGQFKKARKLQTIYDNVKISKPNIKNVNPELDSRFIKFDMENNTFFDIWITITSIGNKIKLTLPIKKTKHFNKMLKKGILKKGIRISKKEIIFMFEYPKEPTKTQGSVLGIDIGQTTLLSCSNGVTSQKDNHGHDLQSITEKIIKKKVGSKGFKRAQEHRTNYINWSVKQLNLYGVKVVNIEKLHQMRKGLRCSKRLCRWTYSEVLKKVEGYCEESGVQIHKVNPTYTSQRCSRCGWVCKRNRKGKQFKCAKCEFTHDADLNAAINISLPLLGITKQQRLKGANNKGFYWQLEG